MENDTGGNTKNDVYKVNGKPGNGVFKIDEMVPNSSLARSISKGSDVHLSHEVYVGDDAGGNLKVQFTRPAYTQELFDEVHGTNARHIKSIADRWGQMKSNLTCSKVNAKSCLLAWLPFLRMLSEYDVRNNLLSDIVSGLTVGIMRIPQGMAYSLLATLPPVYGLYVSFFPVLIYCFFGTSRHISIGTFAVTSLMVGSAIEKAHCEVYSNNNVTLSELSTFSVMNDNQTLMPVNINGTEPHVMSQDEIMCKVGVACALTFITGVVQIGMGLCRLGFVTIYLSDPLTRGLTTGAAIHVFTSQIKYIFGLKVDSYQGPLKLIYTYIDFFRKITKTNVAALVMSIVCIIVLALVKELANPKVKKVIKMPIPMELILVILGTITSYYWKMGEKFDVDVVGLIPTGIPAPTFPSKYPFSSVVVDAISIALVSFAINLSLAKLFAKKYNYDIDANQELKAYGLSNAISSMFNCFVSAASLSRSLVQEGVGGKTQIAGLISSLMILVVLFAIGPLFAELPTCVLAAIIIVSLKGMFLQFRDLKELWLISIYDFLTWLVVFVGVVLLDVDMGLGIGIGFCLLTVVFRTQRPYTCLLGRVQSTDIYKNLDLYPSATEIPGVKIFRLESSLYFANAEHFVKKLFSKTKLNPRVILAEREKLAKKTKERGDACCQLRRRRVATFEIGSANEDMPDIVKPDLNIQSQIEKSIEDKSEESSMDLNTNIETTDIIIDCTTMGYIDYVGVNTLSQVMEEYEKVDINISLAGCKAVVREMLEAVGFYEDIPRDSIYVSVHDAVLVALQKNSVCLHKTFSTSEKFTTRM